MPSSLGWIAHDERDRMTRVLALFREKPSRGELDLGGIRDSIAEQLFPGTSTLCVLLPAQLRGRQLNVIRRQTVYRLACVQPRQEDLAAYLGSQGLSDEHIAGC